MRMVFAALALATVLAPAGGAMAQSLPNELRPIGSMDYPYNLIIPNYSERPDPAAWEGFYWKPTLSYNTMSFNHLRDADGITLGASAGYDFRYYNFVLGPTADLSYDFLYGDKGRVDGIPGFKAHTDFDGSVGARAGFMIMDRTLVYATGGYAFSHLNVKNSDFGGSDSSMLSGWTAGGGIEYLWNDSYSLRFEYRRVEFGSERFDSLPANRDDIQASMDKFSFGFVHRF
jgi:outer membrane immunogenic protein